MNQPLFIQRLNYIINFSLIMATNDGIHHQGFGVIDNFPSEIVNLN